MSDILEFIKEVNDADFWDVFEPDTYKYNLSMYGLSYSDYDDPDTMWEDFLNAVIEYNIQYIVNNSEYSYNYNDTTGKHEFKNNNKIIGIKDWDKSENNWEEIKTNIIEQLENFKNIVCN